jgi:hypothetical protein
MTYFYLSSWKVAVYIVEEIKKITLLNIYNLHFFGKCSVNMFPRQRIRKQQSNNFRCYATTLSTRLHNNRGSGVSFFSPLKLYNEDFTQLVLKLSSAVGSCSRELRKSAVEMD